MKDCSLWIADVNTDPFPFSISSDMKSGKIAVIKVKIPRTYEIIKEWKEKKHKMKTHNESEIDSQNNSKQTTLE